MRHPYKPNGGALRHYLSDSEALILLDDVELERDEVEELLDFAPACRFVTTSSAGRMGVPQQSVALPGLPDDDALALITCGLGRSLADDEEAAAGLAEPSADPRCSCCRRSRLSMAANGPWRAWPTLSTPSPRRRWSPPPSFPASCSTPSWSTR